ncbi:E3 ubiquitin-protein ligase Siah1-like [Centruroides sculpturatus]|uniref:E3 ubiquitin-protein ligase Siah1-like n=1 Tax=Centruroides sculpturatus TaxID=218467 RepID=UPI000C6D24DF|nr:E3 ubiquitin-protein ligase Siah1-like [Centruroides sculpturatus]
MDPTLANLLMCPICYSQAQTPVYQCTNGHIVCSDCRSRITNCHTCREPLGHIRSLIVEQILRTMQAPCSFLPFGCPEVLREADRQPHEEICLFRPIPCPFHTSPCTWEGARSHLPNHLLTVHPQIPKLTQNTIFFGGVDTQITGGTWAAMLECYSQIFLVKVSKTTSNTPSFIIKIYLLTKPTTDTKYIYNIKFKRGDHAFRWTSLVHEIYGESTPPSPVSIPSLELPSDIIHFFGSHHNFKFILNLSPLPDGGRH